ncbi:MAG: APC family permease [Acetilactobacillus jinshanensis]
MMQGVVYTVLCFVGFEVACTVATRTRNPKRSIPLALLLTILGGMIIFAFVSYAVVIGFGTNNVSALANSSAPLNDLATKFISPEMALLVDFAIFLSTFGAAVCVTNGASYMFYAMGQKGYLPKRLGQFNYHHNAPSHAVTFWPI